LNHSSQVPSTLFTQGHHWLAKPYFCPPWRHLSILFISMTRIPTQKRVKRLVLVSP
jgi:hypothetical protein